MSIIKKDGDGPLTRPIVKKSTGLGALRKQIKSAKAFEETMSKLADETLVLCIDTSGSMSQMCEYKPSGNCDTYGYPIYEQSPLKIDAARDAAQKLVEASTRSFVGLVRFETDAALLVEPTHHANPALTDGFRQLVPAGMTDMAGGIRVSEGALTHSVSKVRRIVLLSDGRPHNVTTALSAATHAASQGIIIDTVAFGQDADRDLLKQIAAIGKGVMKEANDAESLVREFLRLEAGTRGLLPKGGG